MSGRRISGVLFIVLVLLIMVWCVITPAPKADDDEPERIYTSIRISDGDTLWKIAEEYCEYGSVKSYVKELCEINHVCTYDYLIPGNSLIVYYH